MSDEFKIDETPSEVVEGSIETANETPKKKNKLMPVLIGIVAVIAIAAIAFFVLKGEKIVSNSETTHEATTIDAYLDADGIAYIPLGDKVIKIDCDNVSDATLTKDRQHIIVLTADGTLYVTDENQSEKAVIAENCGSISNIRDDGFFYKDKSSTDSDEEDNDDDSEDTQNVYRVLYSDNSVVKLGEDVGFAVADNTTSVVYATDDSKIYTLASTDTEPTKIGNWENEICLCGISDDGQISIWNEATNDDTYTLYLNDGELKEDLGENEYAYSWVAGYAVRLQATKDNNLFVITDIFRDKMWFKTPGEETIEIGLGQELDNSKLYVEAGKIEFANAKNVSNIYLSVTNDEEETEYEHVYNVNVSGEREKILSNVKTFTVANGYIFYIDEDDNLYSAKLDGASISNETKISSDVYKVRVSSNGSYVYYMKNVEDSLGMLYCWKNGSDEPIKIASDVYASTMYLCTDEETVLFFKDTDKAGDSSYICGTLCYWSYGDKNPAKMTSDVLVEYVDSYIDTYVDVNDFSYLKFSYTDSTEDSYEVIANLMHYNGKESAKLAGDVLVD